MKKLIVIAVVAVMSMSVMACGNTNKVAETVPVVVDEIEVTSEVEIEAINEDEVEISVDDEVASELSQEEIEAMMIDAINEELN